MFSVMMRRRLRSSCAKSSRNNGDAVGANELLNEANELREQRFLAACPVFLHLVVDIARSFEDDLLGAKFTREAIKIDLRDLGHVRLAV